ncbi:MAG: GNAT family N-acetyltransferase [Acidobacteria bacterium]|nr:GNAT family N-acetyltransferase [Acidobacteriota bacterium]
MIETPRLKLRLWRDSDRAPFAELNADPEVMRHFPATLTRAGSDDLVDRIERHYERHGFTVYAAERKDSGEFIGFIGLAAPEWEAYFTPCVEIGWRLAAKHWNQGFATEGARAALRYGFEVLGLKEIVSFAVVGNVASRRVMEKIGMRYEGEFDHPRLPEGHALRRHVLYRVGATDCR